MHRFSIILISAILLFTNSCDYLKRNETIVTCHLITKDDAEKISGMPMYLEREVININESTCLYTNMIGEKTSHLQVTFQTAATEDDLIAADEMLKKFKSQFGKIEEIEGISDAAWFETNSDEQIIHVRRNTVGFLINATSSRNSLEATRTEMRNVSRHVAEQLYR